MSAQPPNPALREAVALALVEHRPGRTDHGSGLDVCLCGHATRIGDVASRMLHLVEVITRQVAPLLAEANAEAGRLKASLVQVWEHLPPLAAVLATVDDNGDALLAPIRAACVLDSRPLTDADVAAGQRVADQL